MVFLFLISLVWQVQSQGITGQTPWPAVTESNELVLVNQAAEYVVALMNLRSIFSNPTMFERTIVAYRCPRGLEIPTRYFLVMDVNEGDDTFVAMVETYQDKLLNWQPILPTPTKNFKESTQDASTPPIVDVNFELWFAASINDEVVISALASAKKYLETVYYALERSQSFQLERLLHAETREESSEASVVRRRSELHALEADLEKSNEKLHLVARNLSAKLALRKSMIEDWEAHREQTRRLLANFSDDSETADSAQRWLLFQSQHKHDMDHLDQVTRTLEASLADAAESCRAAGARADQTRQALRQAEARRAGTTGTHVFLVVQMRAPVPATSDDMAAAAALKAAVRERRQVILYSSDWRGRGVAAWALLANHPFVAAIS